MHWSNAFIPTLREAPADAEAASHKLLVRGGFMRQLMSGSYSLLPLGRRVAGKVSAIVRSEMDRIGAQEVDLPALHPADIWRRSGRWDVMGDELFRLRDRKDTDLCLGMTHEEIIALLAGEIRSYRQLPQIWYQIQTKFRDEPRPKSGLLRVREFQMKDAYSLDLDEEGLDRSFVKHFEAYRRIFDRCGLDPIAVEASSGAMGGSESIEFMVPSDAGEDWVASCRLCGYAANLEKASSNLPPAGDPPGPAQPEKFATPNVHTIEELERFPGGAPADRQIKTLVYVLDGRPALVLLRGDHPLAEQKLLDATGARECRPARDAEIREALGASAGSLGAVGARGIIVLADEALRGRRDMTTGANEDGFHLRGVDVERDIRVDRWLDLREVREGEPCPACDSPLAVQKTIEVGHIFKLGTRYSEAFDVRVQSESGDMRPVIMGSYGIGIGRTLAAIVEASHDERGISWPVSVAPYEAVITCLNVKEPAVMEAGGQLYEALRGEGVDVLLDDRDESPGVKFKDAELVGIPYRLTVGPKGLARETVDVVRRRDGRTFERHLHKVAGSLVETIAEERR